MKQTGYIGFSAEDATELETTQDDAQVAMESSVTKKSRLPRTATATHGLTKTIGSRGGTLAGALHSMSVLSAEKSRGDFNVSYRCSV